MNIPACRIQAIPMVMAGLILGTVAFLLEGGPFFNRWEKGGTSRVSSLYVAGDDRIFTDAGNYDKAAHEYRSREVEGPLVFGPYVGLAPGRYSVSWVGTVQQASQPRFEIVSMGGGVIAADTASLPPSRQVATLHNITFSLPHAAEGLEFRVIVKRTDALAVRAVELATLPPTPGQP